MRQALIFMCVVVIMKYIEAGVITSASEIWNNNNIVSEKYPGSNTILEDLKLRKSTIPKKYWISNNIPLLKKIPKVFAKSMNRLSKYPDSFYKELYGINTIEEKVKNRMHNVIKSNLHFNDASSLRADSVSVEEQIDEEVENLQNVEDVVEISLAQDDDATTEDIPSNIDEGTVEDGNQKLLKEFIKSHTVIPTKSDCHSDSSEAKKDLNEFIFMLDSQVLWEDVVDDADFEMTTQVDVAKSRSKRSVNMIEEENAGTTVSGFKYTGQDVRLSDDLHYKNINS